MGDPEWFHVESANVTRRNFGGGFITWSVAENPELLDLALTRHRKAMMLSFSNPEPFATRIEDAGAPLIHQVHTLEQTFHAVDVGADVVVA